MQMLSRVLVRCDGVAQLRPYRLSQQIQQYSISRARLAPRSIGSEGSDVSKIRNIGIIAHIDAGKTTTTERMLYYSGHTRRIGNVDDGSTVTDFLPAERARGVTIQSAAISFTWPPLSASNESKSPRTSNLEPHTIQLIDTPGHADFTFEVQRSLRILDGAVCIIDGVAGVEAQTEKVWYQAAKYQIPKIVYVNKLDREGAAFGRTVRHVATRLHAWPAVCQIPWWDGKDGSFVGVGDAVSLRAIRWSAGGDGNDFEVFELGELENIDAPLNQEILKARTALVELLSENDEVMVEKYLEFDEDPLRIPPDVVLASLRRCVIDPDISVVPVLAGASFRNIGVQPLLDAVIQLLPSPSEAPDPEIDLNGDERTLGDLFSAKLAQAGSSKKAVKRHEKSHVALIENLEACALAFKVVQDARKGLLVYVRVYSGTLRPQSSLFNTSLQEYEKASQLLKVYADASTQVDSISTGQIGVIPGLKLTRTGDTLIHYTGSRTKTGPPSPMNSLHLRPINSPPPVFFASIEPHSVSDERNVKEALDILVREDPSLEVSKDEESGQTLLSGMGEFHLEIAHDRLINHLKAKARMGNIEITYRETILQPSPSDIYIFDREQGGKQSRASCLAQVEPLSQSQDRNLNSRYDTTFFDAGNRITIFLRHTTPQSSHWNGELPPHLNPPQIHSALKNGVLAALSRGINYPYQICDTHVILTLDPVAHIFGTDTTPTALTAVARQATKAVLAATALKHGSALMELYMNVVISCDDTSLGAVMKDLSSNRSGHVLSLEDGSTTSGPTINETEVQVKRVDVSKVYAPPDPFEGEGDDSGARVGGQRSVTARVPLKEMVGYLKHLRSLTQGRGTFVMSADCFERVVGQRERDISRGLRGQ